MAPQVQADTVKVGIITTLSGGGSGLGVDVRDGFMLAINNANNADLEVVIEDDGRKGCHKNYFNVAWQNDSLHEAMGNYANGADY